MAEFVPPKGEKALIWLAAGAAAGFNEIPNWKTFVSPATLPGYKREYRGDLVFSLALLFGILTLVVVVARLISRWKITGWRLGVDDWLIVPATIFCELFVANTLHSVKKGGLGKHHWEITYSDVEAGVVNFWLHLLLYIPAVTLTKLSILFFVRRLASPGISPKMNRLIWFLCYFLILFNVTVFFVYMNQCTPFKANFILDLRFHPETKCPRYLVVHFILAGVHVVSDFVLLALPIYMVYHMQMKLFRKFLVCILLSLGLLACCCSVVRMTYFIPYVYTEDMAWDGVPVTLWGVLETTIAIITASCPALKPLFKWVVGAVSTKATPTPGNSFPSNLNGPVRKSWSDNWTTVRGQHSRQGSIAQLMNERDIEMQPQQLDEPGIMKTMSVDVSYMDAARVRN